MTCPHCGNNIDATTKYCEFCGNPIDEQLYKAAKQLNSIAVTSIWFGAIAIFCSLFISILGWVFGGVALSMALNVIKKERTHKKARVGVLLCCIALGICLISTVLALMIASGLIKL